MHNNEISIVYICDEYYVMPTCVSIQSMHENKKNSVYNIYILGIELSDTSKQLIKSVKLNNINIKLLDLENKYKQLNTTHEYVSKSALFKFDIPLIFKDLDKILYLDSDTIILKDLSELFNTDITDYYAGVVKDLTSIFIFKDNERIGTQTYFNSGMMLLNLKNMRSDNISQKLLEYKLNSRSVKYMDQDCFNSVLAPKLKFLPPEYNYMTSNEYLYKQKICERNFKEPVMVHLTPEKPWKNHRMPYAKEWDKYFKKSVCKKLKLEKNKKFIYKEKMDNKRIIHIGKIKLTYHKSIQGGFPSSKSCNFKTYDNLYNDIKKNISKIPNDIDLVVGVPRSGMIPAYMIGFMKNLQVVSLNEFLAGNICKIGERPLNPSGKNVLVVDDTCCSGKAILKVKSMLQGCKNNYNIRYLCVYSTNEAISNIDISLMNLKLPRMFQWNYLNHINIQNSCFDMDGVLCEDPIEEQNDDGENYIDFIKNAKAKFIPKYKIYAIVTSRLEKYRVHTEKWLADNGVMYEKLYMLNLPDKETRIRLNAHASFKSKIYRKLKNTKYFYESDRNQAKAIHDNTGKPVICVDTDEIFQ